MIKLDGVSFGIKLSDDVIVEVLWGVDQGLHFLLWLISAIPL